MNYLDRVSFNPAVMGGRPIIRGMRVTVGMILGQLAGGHTTEEVLDAYPYLERQDISAALEYAAWRVQEIDLGLSRGPGRRR